MNQLVIDAGNSKVKIAVFKNGEPIHKAGQKALSLPQLKSLINDFKPVATILSSVVDLDQSVLEALKTLPKSIILDAKTPLPFKNKYATPLTLGRDRLANAAGAQSLFPERNVLVIDAGTCLKFDFINEQSEYLGGAISPGLNMRYRALNHYTDQLPLLTPVETTPFIGDSTESSIHSGIVNGMTAEISGIIDQYEKTFVNVQLILTGGNARFFLNHLKKSIFASPELTLKGLQSILQFNEPNDQ